MMRWMTKVIFPLMISSFWIWFSYSVCSTTGTEFNLLYFLLMAGLPFGISKMTMIMIPRHFGLAGSMGVLALDCIVGGFVGIVCLAFYLLRICMNTAKLLTGRL